MSLPPARSRAGFVSACQQLLTLGVVLAVLTPAAGVLSLDVVREAPASTTPASLPGAGPAPSPGRGAPEPSTVPTGPVEAEVEDYQLTAPEGARVARDRLAADAARTGAGRGSADAGTEVRSEALPVADFGTVGVTWAPGTDLEHDAVAVRHREDEGSWSRWVEAEVEQDHAPEAGSAEAAAMRPGSDAVVVGDVDAVQVRVTSVGPAPADLQAVVIEPGAPTGTTRELPAIQPAAAPAADVEGTDGAGRDALGLAAASTAPRPTIYSRAQWGADEDLRDGSPRYGTVQAGFVHHTVNANSYTREQVPGLLRSIYAYHTQSRGWSDVGYNFLVDRFGRIWEGRYGGVTRAVVGAHTLGYNDHAFAMSAIGNFDVTGPPQVMVDAYGALFGWKLGIHGVDAGSMRQQVGSRTLPAVNGHSDAGSTACPGRYLYERLGEIRREADAAQETAQPQPQPQPEPEPAPEPAPLDSQLVGKGWPDLVLRRDGDQQAVIVPTGGLTTVAEPQRVVGDWSAWPETALGPDLTGDGVADLLARDATGVTAVGAGAGDGAGAFAAPVTTAGGPGPRHDLVVAVGDADGDGTGDLVGRSGARLVAFRGDGDGGFRRERLTGGWSGYVRLVPAGDVTGDGDPDLLAQQGDGSLWLRAGSTGSSYAAPRAVAGDWSVDDVIAAGGDLTRDGTADLVVRRAGDGATVVAPGRGDGTFGLGLGRLHHVRAGDALTGGAQVGGSRQPDLLVRRGERLLWLENLGTVETRPVVETGVDLSGAALVLNAGDWDGDGEGDLVTRAAGVLSLHRGDGSGTFAAPRELGRGFGRVRGLQAVGDVTDDGRADLTGRRNGTLWVYPGAGVGGIGSAVDAGGLVDPRDDVQPGTYETLVQVSDLRRGPQPDLVGADAEGRLWLLPVTGRGVGTPRLLSEGTGVASRLQ